MEIAVIGATGKTGAPLCAQAKAAGHTVKAFSASGRPIPGVDLPNTALDARDAAAVEAALAGVDAIVSVVGGELETRPKAIEHLIAAAKAHGITRLIGVGGAGALDGPGGGLLCEQPWFPAQMKPVTEMHRRAVALLETSGLDWTFVCPPFMTDGEVTGGYKHQADAAILGSMKVRHADVAHLILRCVDEGLYIGHRVAVGE